MKLDDIKVDMVIIQDRYPMTKFTVIYITPYSVLVRYTDGHRDGTKTYETSIPIDHLAGMRCPVETKTGWILKFKDQYSEVDRVANFIFKSSHEAVLHRMKYASGMNWHPVPIKITWEE